MEGQAETEVGAAGPVEEPAISTVAMAEGPTNVDGARRTAIVTRVLDSTRRKVSCKIQILNPTLGKPSFHSPASPRLLKGGP